MRGVLSGRMRGSRGDEREATALTQLLRPTRGCGSRWTPRLTLTQLLVQLNSNSNSNRTSSPTIPILISRFEQFRVLISIQFNGVLRTNPPMSSMSSSEFYEH
jgi:hypothetical protein